MLSTLSSRPLQVLAAVSSTILVVFGLVWVGAPAQAIGMDCHGYTQGSGSTANYERICQVTNEWPDLGASFTGGVFWWYADSHTGGRYGTISGTIKDTFTGTDCASMRYVLRAAPGGPIQESTHFGSTACGKGTSKGTSCSDFNAGGGCVPISLQSPTGEIDLQVCSPANTCTTFWKQTIQASHN